MAIKKITKKKMTKKEADRYQKVLSEVEKKGDKAGSLSKTVFESPIDLFKWGICKEIIALKVKKSFSSKKMSELMGTDKSKTSLVLNYRIDNFSIERLLGYLISLKNIEKETDKKIDEILNLFSPLDAA